jgi:hypothetical protein
MRTYKVQIVAEHQGHKIEFLELVVYPELKQDQWGRVCEELREHKAISQVRERMPYLTNVRAEWSMSAD